MRSGRVRRAAVLGVLASCVLATSVIAPTEAVGASESTEVLVHESDPRLEGPDVQVERVLGFGWVLATTTATDRDLAGLSLQPDIVHDVWPNARYELASDPLFGDQWHLENVGQTGGTPGADIGVLEAWSTTVGSSTEVIAVIDTGIDLDHPDLVDRLWVNPGELPANGEDDDGNGYVDDVNGWDMADVDATPQDTYWHGTAVAGTAVASTNGVGTEGVSPAAVVMPIRACPGATCSLSAIVESVHYAVENGATIINLSLGNTSFHQPLADAITAAGAAGIVVVAAAGNSGSDNDSLPTYYPASLDGDHIIAVAATDHDDLPADFGGGSATNYGATTVDLAAPGSSIVTTVIDGYGSASGTSFAAPLVAGSAALVRSIEPSIEPAQIRDLLIATVDPIPALDGLVVANGRLDSGRAVSAAASNLPPTAIATAEPSLGWAPLTATLDATESFDPDGSISTWGWSSATMSSAGEISEMTFSTVGVHPVSLTVTDILGASAVDVVDVLVGEDFLDTRTSIFRLDIAWMSALGITRGCNPPINDRFCPNDSLTRGQLAAFLTRTLDLPPTTQDPFTDDDGSIFEDDINRLAAAGITAGCNPPANDHFCPTDQLTRAQLAAMLRRSDP